MTGLFSPRRGHAAHALTAGAPVAADHARLWQRCSCAHAIAHNLRQSEGTRQLSRPGSAWSSPSPIPQKSPPPWRATRARRTSRCAGVGMIIAFPLSGFPFPRSADFGFPFQNRQNSTVVLACFFLCCSFTLFSPRYHFCNMVLVLVPARTPCSPS